MDTLTCNFKSYNLKVYYGSYAAPIEHEMNKLKLHYTGL